MAPHSPVRDWVSSQSPRTYFKTADVPGSSRAVESALSRMAMDPDGPITRARQGIYWVKPSRSRFGSGHPDPVGAALVAAGPGAGPSGWSASQVVGLSTQVPAVPTIAVTGRAPKGLDGVKIVSRSNVVRSMLDAPEVAVLEVLREFPRFTDRGTTWTDACRTLNQFIDKRGLDRTRLAKVADHEVGAATRDRAHQLLGS